MLEATALDATEIAAPQALECPDTLNSLENPEDPEVVDAETTTKSLAAKTVLPSLDKPPLDPRVLHNVLTSYDGETVIVPQCDSPVFHGHGVAVFRTGFTYSGSFHYGRMHGRGRIDWANGIVYEGDFVDSEMTGHGAYAWTNGSSYVGDVVRGRRHGHGAFCTGTRGTVNLDAGSDGSLQLSTQPLLQLPFAFHGSETFKALEGVSNARYDGQWVDGLPHGFGVLVFDDDQHVRYEGDFVAGKRHGHGQMRYASGNMYVGQWESDVKNGHGTMLWMAGNATAGPIEKYDGAWRNDRPHGHGRHVWLGAAKQQQRTQREKNWYEGQFTDGVRHGLGAFFYANGARYEGEWYQNVKHGAGVFFYEDGRVFVGEFRDDRAVESEGGSSNDQTTNSKILLFVDELLPLEGRDKARKLLENAVLRLNTELRALYRQYIALPAPGSPSRQPPSPVKATDELEASAVLMEFYECRRLLADSGLRLSAGHLERHLASIRDAQRSTSVPDEWTASRPSVRVADPVTLAASLPEVVPPSRLLLFREFVELLVRLAHEEQQSGLTEVACLAEAFVALYERLARNRIKQSTSGQGSTAAWSSAQLHAKELHRVYHKHHAAFQRLFLVCDRRPHGGSQDNPVGEPKEASAAPETVSVRSLLALLQELRVFSPRLRLRQALLSLQEAFSLDDAEGGGDPRMTTLDPFFVETPLLFTDFVDAIAIVLLTKQQQQEQAEHQHGQAPIGTPLFAIVDEFAHAMQADLSRGLANTLFAPH